VIVLFNWKRVIYVVKCPFCGYEGELALRRSSGFVSTRFLGCSVLAVKEYSTTIVV